MPLSIANNSEREFIYAACDRLCVLAGTTRPVSTDPIWTVQKKGMAAVIALTPAVGTVTAVTATAPLLSSGGATPDISMPAASGSVDGYLSAADWTAFDAKQPAGSYITSLTGDVTAAGPGAAAATLANTAVAPGAYGSSTSIPSFTVDSKGRITLASGNVVIAPAGTLTGATLAANVLASSLTSVGTLTGGATGAGFTIALGVSTLTGDLPLANFVQASGASILLGRGSAAGAGDYQEVTLGSGITMTGTVLSATGTGGTVTSVGLTVPSFLSVAGSPVTTAGTLAVTLATQAQKTFFAGPTSGADAAPTFRTIAVADIPALPYAPAALTDGHIFVGSAGNLATDVAMSGDATIINTGALTLANTAVGAGSYGSSTSIPSFTVDSKGRLTAAAGNAVIAPAGTLTGATLAANVLASSLTSVGTLTGGATGAGFTIALGTSTLTGDLPLANLAQASGASILLGRGSAGGAGDYQEITLGGGLTMTGTVLSAPTAGVGATVTIVDDTTTNATMYLTWVTANTGNLPLKVTSTKLTYNPSTGAFSTGTGAISGGAVSGTTGTFTKATGGDSIVVTNGAASNKTGYIGTDATYVYFSAGTYLTSQGIYFDQVAGTVGLQVGGATKVLVNSSGMNGALGQTTPAAASVTTLNASGTITLTKATGGRTISNVSGDTSGVYMDFLTSAGAKGYLGTANQILSGGSVNDIGMTSDTGNIIFGSTTAYRMVVGSAGTSITGTLGASSQIYYGTIDSSLSGYSAKGSVAGAVIGYSAHNTSTSASSDVAYAFQTQGSRTANWLLSRATGLLEVTDGFGTRGNVRFSIDPLSGNTLVTGTLSASTRIDAPTGSTGGLRIYNATSNNWSTIYNDEATGNANLKFGVAVGVALTLANSGAATFGYAGSFTSVSDSLTVGPGGTAASGNGYNLIVNGANAAGYGPLVTFRKNGTTKGYLSTWSALAGGSTSDDMTLYSLANWLVYAGSTAVATFSASDLTVNGTFTSTVTSGHVFNSQSATTGSNYFRLQNTGGVGYAGLDDSTGSALSGVAYAWVTRVGSGREIISNVNGTNILRISSTGGAFTGALSATGALSGSNFSGSSSGTNTGDQTTISGNAGTATTLQTTRTIGGSNFNGSANVTSFPIPGDIGGTTPANITGTTIRANTGFNYNGIAGSSGTIVAAGLTSITVSGGIITGWT